MTETVTTAASANAASARKRIIVALDVDAADDARRLLELLKDEAGAFKIGLQLFAAAGPTFVRECVDSGAKIFLDLKFHDIPNTVASAAVEAARLGVWMFNVHASGGSEMMKRTVEVVDEVCDAERLRRPLITAVTVLTSSAAETLRETGVTAAVEDQVLSLARLAKDSGMDGVVASAQETAAIRQALGGEFVVVTPGIRPEFATVDDQKRVTTPKAALANGSDHLVIGRPITRAEEPVAAVRAIISEIGG